MDKLTALLEEHTSYYSGDECSCGVDSYSTEGWDFNAHLAEMLLQAGVHVGKQYCIQAPLPEPLKCNHEKETD